MRNTRKLEPSEELMSNAEECSDIFLFLQPVSTGQVERSAGTGRCIEYQRARRHRRSDSVRQSAPRLQVDLPTHLSVFFIQSVVQESQTILVPWEAHIASKEELQNHQPFPSI